MPSDQWKLAAFGKTMYPGEVIQSGIGQGYDAASPLQLLNAYCSVINGGKLWQPPLVSFDHGPQRQGHQRPADADSQAPVSASRAGGPAARPRARSSPASHTYDLVDLPIKVAGKTGTAEFGTVVRGVLPYHEWFVGYTPGDAFNGNFSSTDSQFGRRRAFVYGADTLGDVSTEIVKYYMWLHYHLGSARSIFYSRTPGYIYPWITKTSNYYYVTQNH